MESPSDAAAAADAESAHSVKTIMFKGRRVPIMLQDANGPCPLLAIANVLLLRNQLQLPAGVGEVSQARLVEMVAGRLLDANSLEGPRAEALSEEQRASLAHNLADAIALLPKLTTGIDVNLRFHDIAGVEYTQETAVFDLLDIPLLHGWLVDPQDEPTALAMGSKSYNELVVQLVTALGSAATPKQLTPTDSLLKEEGEAAAGAVAAAALGSALQQQQQQQQQVAANQQQAAQQPPPSPPPAQRIDADQLSAALRDTLRVSLPAHRDVDATSSGPASAKSGVGLDTLRAASNLSMHTSDSMHSFVGRMLTDIVGEAFTSSGATPTSATPTASRSTGQPRMAFASSGGASSAAVAVAGEGEGEEATSALQPSGSNELQPGGGGSGLSQLAVLGSAESWRVELSLVVDETATSAPVRAQLELRPELPPSPFESFPSSQLGDGAQRRSTPITPHPSAASLRVDEPAAAAGPGPSRLQAVGGAGSPPGSGGGSPSEAAVRDALLVQQFLDGHPSQLTYHGLVALQEGLRPNQLAVFFRNNHFCTMFKHEGQLYLLATDEGFQYESDVVWEHLMSVDGDTALVDAEFRPFQHHTDATAGGAAAAGAGQSGVDAEWAAATAAAAAATGEHTHDSDMALAMQLQAEEEDRVRLERQQAAAARQQEEQRRQAQQAQQQRQVLPSQRRPGSGGASSARKKKEKKASSDSPCTLM